LEGSKRRKRKVSSSWGAKGKRRGDEKGEVSCRLSLCSHSADPGGGVPEKVPKGATRGRGLRDVRRKCLISSLIPSHLWGRSGDR